MIHVCVRARCVSGRLSGSFKDDQWEKDQRNNSLLLTSCIFNAHPFNIWWAQRLCRYCGVNWHTSAFANQAPKFKSQFCENEKRPRFLWAVLIFSSSAPRKKGTLAACVKLGLWFGFVSCFSFFIVLTWFSKPTEHQAWTLTCYYDILLWLTCYCYL